MENYKQTQVLILYEECCLWFFVVSSTPPGKCSKTNQISLHLIPSKFRQNHNSLHSISFCLRQCGTPTALLSKA